MENAVTVTFAPAGLSASVKPGATVLEAARAAGVVIPAACGGRGVCGSCGVRVLGGGLAPADELELSRLARAPENVRLACRARVLGAVTVRPVFEAPEVDVAIAADATRAHVVVGVDLGTTGVSAVAAATTSGQRLGSATILNAQVAWGSDVLSRISAAQDGHSEELATAAMRSIGEVLESVVPPDAAIDGVVVAGNTAMAALLAGIDVSTLAAHPFTQPVLPESVRVPRQSGLPPATATLVPALGGFVGGDILAGLVATGMMYAPGPALLVDLGTNAEIVLVRDDRILAASAAAGPAFEGAGIESGIAATPGAVSSVNISGDSMVVETIGGEPPTGLSGAGLISLLAELRRAGHLAADGRMQTQGRLSKSFEVGADGVLRLRVADGERVVLSQLDVRAAQLAKAAVSVAVATVLESAGVRAQDLTEVNVAGAFGAAVQIADLVEIGLIPDNLTVAPIVVGNSSLAGALAIALEPDILVEASERASEAETVDLVSGEGFGVRLLQALSIEPHSA